MKRYFLLAMLVLGWGVRSSEFGVLISHLHGYPADLRLPELFNGIHDQYGYNFVNTVMAGRGNTGVAVADKIASAIYNPATYRADNHHFSVEILVKAPVDDFNTHYWRVPTSSDDNKPLHYDYKIGEVVRTNRVEYMSPFPISYFGFGLASIDDFNFGLSYHLNRSIEYSTLTRRNYGGPDYVSTPTFYEHQITLTTNKKIGPITLGLNNILLLQHHTQYHLEGTLEDFTFTESIYRAQIGFLYEHHLLGVGASYMPKTKKNIGISELSIDAVYHSKILGGVSFNLPYQMQALFDVEFNRYYETSEYLENQLIYKVGFEKSTPRIDYRAGFMHIPSVYTGEYIIPLSKTINIHHNESREDIPHIGYYKDTTQNLITIGLSTQLSRGAYLHIAGMHGVGSNVKRSQFMMAMDYEL